jgi:hypothetical protein
MRIHPQTLNQWFRDLGFDMNRIANPCHIRLERISDGDESWIGVFLEVRVYDANGTRKRLGEPINRRGDRPHRRMANPNAQTR